MRRIGVAAAFGVVLGTVGVVGVAYATAGVALALGAAVLGPRPLPALVPVRIRGTSSR